jgi:hypothetical protein
VTDASKPVEEEGPDRRAKYKAHPETKRRKQGVVGLCEKKGKEKRA